MYIRAESLRRLGGGYQIQGTLPPRTVKYSGAFFCIVGKGGWAGSAEMTGVSVLCGDGTVYWGFKVYRIWVCGFEFGFFKGSSKKRGIWLVSMIRRDRVCGSSGYSWIIHSCKDR